MEPPRLDVGIYPHIHAADYHADPAIEPSASASILRTLYNASPEHAATDHPRLGTPIEPEPATDAQNAGTILHQMMLGGPIPYRELHFDSYRKAAAQEAKAEAILDGLIPILSHKLAELSPVATALERRLRDEYADIWAALNHPETEREVTLIWRERGILCRCRFDILPPRFFGYSLDLKFTGRSAAPEEWSRKVREEYLFQANLYPRAVLALRGDAPEFRFLVCETDPPYGVSVHASGPYLAGKAKRRVDVALTRWQQCLSTGKWPGYPNYTHYAEAPGWWESQDDFLASRDAILDEGA